MTSFPLRQLHKTVDRACESAQKKVGDKPACKAGCSFCCRFDQGYVGALEADHLIRYIQSEPSLADIPALLEKTLDEMAAEVLAGRARGEPQIKGKVNLPNGRWACVLLDRSQGTCRAYTHRPIACRVTYSTDVASCEQFTKDQKSDGWKSKPGAQGALLGQLMARGGLALRNTVLQISTDPKRQPLIFALGERLAPDALKRFLKVVNADNLTDVNAR